MLDIYRQVVGYRAVYHCQSTGYVRPARLLQGGATIVYCLKDILPFGEGYTSLDYIPINCPDYLLPPFFKPKVSKSKESSILFFGLIGAFVANLTVLD